MPPNLPVKRLVLAAALLGAGNAARAEAAVDAKLMELVQQLNDRVERLERRNAELEKQLHPETAPTADIDRRLRSLEQASVQLEQTLDSETISENEPELTARLKAVEQSTLAMKKPVSKIEALEGLGVEASLIMVAQTPRGLPHATTDGNSQLNYRADVTMDLPLDSIGNLEHKLVAHFRLGQGLGLNTPVSALGAFASAPNAVAFRASGSPPDDSVAILGQAYYQAGIPLPFGGFGPRSKERLELTVGKMDIFGFFDQNAIADDESRQFLNSVFVHNPILDAGGEVGVDANGFQPGFVASYSNHVETSEPWRVSLGIFGAGHGANYQHVFSSPLIMMQAETRLQFEGLTGNYRVYGWRTGHGAQLDGNITHHFGWGISVDQQIDDGVVLFGRYGRLGKGQVRFDQALTLGAEFNGSRWSRGGDTLGIAAGWLRASDAYRGFGGSGDIKSDGSGVFAFAPDGAEKVAELYYRYRISDQFELTPDVQYVWRMGANPGADDVAIYGLRAQFSY